jgi:hypothetical protein
MLNLPHALCVRAVRGRRGAISSGKVWKGLERSESVLARTLLWVGGFGVAAGFLRGRTRSARTALRAGTGAGARATTRAKGRWRAVEVWGWTRARKRAGAGGLPAWALPGASITWARTALRAGTGAGARATTRARGRCARGRAVGVLRRAREGRKPGARQRAKRASSAGETFSTFQAGLRRGKCGGNALHLQSWCTNNDDNHAARS